jgi:hypothetical protein
MAQDDDQSWVAGKIWLRMISSHERLEEYGSG